MGDAKGAGLQHPGDAVELPSGHDGGEGVFHPDLERTVRPVRRPERPAGAAPSPQPTASTAGRLVRHPDGLEELVLSDIPETPSTWTTRADATA